MSHWKEANVANHKRTIKLGMGAVGLLSFVAAVFSLIDGDVSAAFWSAGYGFFGVGMALAYDDHTLPLDGTEDTKRKVSPGQKLFTLLALILGGTACLVWYITEFMKIV